VCVRAKECARECKREREWEGGRREKLIECVGDWVGGGKYEIIYLVDNSGGGRTFGSVGSEYHFGNLNFIVILFYAYIYIYIYNI